MNCEQNFNDLLYCNITVNTSVGVIAKVDGAFVLHVNNSKEAMLIRLVNYIYNDSKQLLSFSWRKKRMLKITTTWGKETGRIA